MTALVFGEIEHVFIPFDTKRKLRQVMIINAIAGNFLSARQLPDMPDILCQPVAKHG